MGIKLEIDNMAERNEVMELLRKYNVRPSKKLGQNFLIDKMVYEKILKVASLNKQDTVLEIGAGLGTLTERLAAKVKKVVAVEVDKKMIAILNERLGLQKNVFIIHDDVLDKPVKLFGVIPPYKVVANIPYNITAPIFKKFLTIDIQPSSMTLLVQKEVGERVAARVGSMSLLALSVQLYGKPMIVDKVSLKSFFPPPDVDSVTLNISEIHPFPFADITESSFWRVAKVGFSAKRKQLKNNLSSGFHIPAEEMEAMFKKVDIPPKARAQELSIEDWRNLAYAVKARP